MVVGGITRRRLTIALVDTRTTHTDSPFDLPIPYGGIIGSFVIDPAIVIPSCSALPYSNALPVVTVEHLLGADSSCTPLEQITIFSTESHRIGEFGSETLTPTNFPNSNHPETD